MKSCNGWPQVPLAEVVTPVQRSVALIPGRSYRTLGVKWWGQGAYERQTIDGSQTAVKTLNEVQENDLIINKIWVRNGSVAVVTHEVAGCVGSNEFPTFQFRSEHILPRWMHWYSKTRDLWRKCDALSRGSSGKNRIRPERFLTIAVPLPSLDEQARIVARVDGLASRITEVERLTQFSDTTALNTLMAAFHEIADGAPRRRMIEVAPLVRRPAEIDVSSNYPQISVRSFGKGTFNNPPLDGGDITWQKPHLVKAGDILVSNIKAWEGAIAVVMPEDDGRYGSHRYLTFVPVNQVMTSQFLCFYLLSREGLYHVGEASPGSADRNRTLSSKKMLEIKVPVPPYEEQLRFNRLVESVAGIRQHREDSHKSRDALLPSLLDRAFRGEL